MSTLEKIKTLLSKSKETKMYAEMILDDGRVLATEDEKFNVGSEVYVVGDDGETEKLSEGEYTLEDGTKIGIDAESKISSLGEQKVEAAEEDKEEEIDEEKLAKAIDEATPDKVDKDKAKEMAKRVKEYAEEEEKEEKEEKEEMASEAEDTDWAKTYEEMKDRIEALEKAVYGENADVEEMKKDEKVEMSKDMVNSLVEEVEHLRTKVVELEKEPGSEGFTHNPEKNSKQEKVNLAKLSTQERVAYFMNSNN
tara:strand:- start:196 stop:951 length:756 start_codon:yes stop_codon:yes gene_type:complete